MSPAERAFVERARNRMSRMQPEMISDYLRSIRIIRESLSEGELARLVEAGQVERLIDEVLSDETLDRALIPLRQRTRQVLEESFTLVIKDLPKSGKIDGVPAVSFDHLSPHVRSAITTLETQVMSSLKDDVRESVREAVKVGLEQGRSPKAVARGIREAVGLGKGQVREVENFRDALKGENGRRISDYMLRNRTVDRLLSKGPLTSEQVERYTETYRKARIAQNANTVARTATLDSYKQGQALSWREAREKGVIPKGFGLEKTWITVGDDRVRPEHMKMDGETVPFDSRYSNGEDVPGESTYNCRCLSRVTLTRTAPVALAGSL